MNIIYSRVFSEFGTVSDSAGQGDNFFFTDNNLWGRRIFSDKFSLIKLLFFNMFMITVTPVFKITRPKLKIVRVDIQVLGLTKSGSIYT